ncbi:hypothetical protein FDECE_11793 [Fusarium decemcellulare]|nr:hypothetical protein FDECE_11793 [Fusarium decemcellulare]
MLDPREYNALDLAQPTDFRSMLKSGELLWGTSCRIPHEEAARVVATLPHQFCFLDAEHSPLNPTLLASLIKTIQYTSNGSMVPYVRLAPNMPDLINYVLLAGAGGIVQPHVQNAEQARQIVSLAKFPPLGNRSYPPLALFGKQTRTKPGQTVYDVWNDHAAVFAQIEDVEGVENVEEIAAVPGIDALMVGAGDLRCSMGLEVGSQDGDEPVFLSALDKIQRAADKNGLAVLGFAMTPEILERRLKLGWRAFVVHSDGSGVFKSGVRTFEDNIALATTLGAKGMNGVNGTNGVRNGNGIPAQLGLNIRMYVSSIEAANVHHASMTVEETEPSRSHVQSSWVVQKFGGTSIGKYPLNIVDNVVKPATCHHRVVVVCSARSTSTKDAGTTNRLLQAYQHCLGISLERSNALIQSIRADHVSAAFGYIKNPKRIAKLVQEIEHQCERVMLLLQATRTIGHGTSHILDRVVSTGERLAASFLSAVLSDRGISSEAVDFSDIIPSNMHSTMDQAFYDSVARVMAERVKACQATVPVVTGFFGPIAGGLLAQVGRGYTDFCASMIAVGLRAHELHVWKEVEGIFTADPSKVPSARMLPIISSDEASELTFHGSEVIHYSAMRLAMRAKVSMRIKNVLNPQAPGTLVVDDCKSASPSPMLSPTAPRAPIAITSKENILLINVRSTERFKAHSFLAGIFSVLDKCNMSIDLICTSEVQVSMALCPQVYLTDEGDGSGSGQKDVQNAIKQLQEYGEVELLHNRTIISLVGRQMRQALSVTGQMFSTLSENRIRIDMIAQGTVDVELPSSIHGC